MYICNGYQARFIFSFFKSVSLFQAFFIVLCLCSILFYPQFCLVLRIVVSSSLIKENCLNEHTDVHSGLSCCLSVWDLGQAWVTGWVWAVSTANTLLNVLAWMGSLPCLSWAASSG